jgi:hypothetical protein
MTGDQARARLSEIEPTAYRELHELARRIRADAREPLRRLAALWRAGGDPEEQKAARVLASTRELAVVPWAQVARTTAAARSLEALVQACQTYAAARDDVLAGLSKMMQRKTLMPPPPTAGMTEEKELPSRECDEAYLLARRLSKTDESDLAHILARREFLLLSPTQRDTEIQSVQKSGKWMRLVEQDPEQVRDEP